MPSHKNDNHHRPYDYEDSQHDLAVDGEPLPSPTEFPGSEGNLVPGDASSDEHDESGNPREHQHTITQDEKMAYLAELNDTLVKELASFRTLKVEMDEKVKKVETELQNSNIRMDSLILEKNWLEQEKRKFELETAALAKETAMIGQEKTELLAEKHSLIAEKGALEFTLSELREEISELKAKLQEAQLAASIAESHINVMSLEIEQLSDEQKKLTAEEEALQAQIYERQSEFSHLQSLNKSLEDELASLIDACTAAELHASVANKIIEDLREEVVNANEGKERLERQLDGSLQGISSLEEHARELISRQQELEAQVQKLENDLECGRNAYEATSLALEQQKESNGSLLNVLEASHSRSRGLEKNLELLRLSFSTVQGDAVKYQQQILSLEGQVSLLLQEKTSLEKVKTGLENEVEKLNSGSEEAITDAKRGLDQNNKQVKLLESSLIKAKQEVICSDQKAYKLKAELELERERFQRMSKRATFALPVAAVSTSALAVVGVVAFLKCSKNQ